MTRNLILGGLLSALFLLAAAISFVWTPYDHTALEISNKLKAPTRTTFLAPITLAATCLA